MTDKADEDLKLRLIASSKRTETGCLEWQRSINEFGYGAFHSMGERLAHRISYRIFVGEFDKKLDICHSCDNRKCIEPSHLFAGTRLENVQDCKRKGRFKFNLNNLVERNKRVHSTAIKEVSNREAIYSLVKTHCKRGHPWSTENTYISRHGKRQCWSCIRIRQKGKLNV